MWVNLTGGEGPRIQKERLYYRRNSAWGLQVVEPPELPVDSNEFQWVPVGPGGLAAPLDHNNKLVIVVVTALRHSVVDSTPRAVDQPGYST